MIRTKLASAVGAALLLLTAAACSTSSSASNDKSGGDKIHVVAAENFWGSIASRLGGEKVTVTNIINNPDADPHDYEPTAQDGRAIASARLMIINGVGYDPWATQLVQSNPSNHRTVITVGNVVGAKPGDNPHRWYNPGDVQSVIDAITAAYKKLDRTDAGYFDAQRKTYDTTTLRPYHRAIAAIKAKFAGTPVGASESIFAMLAPALGLDLVTPPAFLKAISEGTEPTAADKTTIDKQIRTRQIKVYIYNSQNATPDIQSQVSAARAAGIPVTTITETLTPAGASFQSWQVKQLTALQSALARAIDK